MLDEREGAVHVLRQYPHHIANWFVGYNGRCGLPEVAALLDHLLLQGQARQLLSGHSQEVLLQMAASLVEKLGLEEHFSSSSSSDEDSGTDEPLFLQRNAGVQPLAADQQPLMVCYRPLLFYMFMEAIAAWAHATLTLRMGFQHAASTRHATYYMKRGSNTHLPPIVLIHGIGVGLAPYMAFLDRVQRRTGRTVIAVQYKHISMRMTHHVPSTKQLAADMEAFLLQQGFRKAALVSHSYGTLVASVLVKCNPGLISELSLLDPVCFAMYLPHLIRNALFFHVGSSQQAGSTASAGAGVRSTGSRFSLRTLLRGVVVRDVHVAAALSRNNFWADCNLFPTDLPADVPVRVVLSGADHLVPVQEVISMLRSSPAASRVEVQVFPERGHGAFVLDLGMQDHIISPFAVPAAHAPASLPRPATSRNATRAPARVQRPASHAHVHALALKTCGCNPAYGHALTEYGSSLVDEPPATALHGVGGTMGTAGWNSGARVPSQMQRDSLASVRGAVRSLTLAPVKVLRRARSLRSSTAIASMHSWVVRSAATVVRVATRSVAASRQLPGSTGAATRVH